MTKPISKLKISKHKPVWEGPCSEGKNGGISQSMLAKFLQCREEFRIKYVLGLKPNDGFSHLLEYGNMWHLCEENLAANKDWEKPLKIYCDELKVKYRTSQPEIEKWYNCCLYQFPIYVDFWKKHPDTKGRTGLFQELVFKVPYTLPSGRVVYLRGKFDGGDLIKDKTGSGIYLFETKTKGEVDPLALIQQLSWDMQTMMYLVALQEHIRENGPLSKASDGVCLKGVRYNVVRRPLSGGKGSIKQKMVDGKMETSEEYYTRLQQYFIEEPEYWFIRFKVEISQKDIDTFKLQFLNPILEQLCDWWDYILDPSWTWNDNDNQIHWRHPYGTRNMLAEGKTSEYDSFIATGNTVGLKRITQLFGELQ